MQKAISDYLDFVYQSRSKKTGTTYKQALQTFLQIVGDDAQLTKDTYIKFLRKTADMNPSTQALCRSAVKGLYYFAADTTPGIDTSFFKMSDKRYALKSPKNIINPDMEGIQKTIDYVNTIRSGAVDLRDKAFILLLADSGLRVSEACGIRIRDVDLMENRAVVAGKGNKQAVVKISSRTRKAIGSYLIYRGHHYSSSPLFIRHDKRAGDRVMPITPGYIWHYIKRRIAEAGADPKTIRVHDFRHYFVTIVYQSKGIKTAQKWARHERIETTNRYTHLVEDDGAEYDDVFNK
jgi:integrase/recombinase XerC